MMILSYHITSVLKTQQQWLPSTPRIKVEVLTVICNVLYNLVHHQLSGFKSYFFFCGHGAPAMLSSLMFTRHAPTAESDWLLLQFALLFPEGALWLTSFLPTLQNCFFSALFSP